jgi:hypothetical protein
MMDDGLEIMNEAVLVGCGLPHRSLTFGIQRTRPSLLLSARQPLIGSSKSRLPVKLSICRVQLAAPHELAEAGHDSTIAWDWCIQTHPGVPSQFHCRFAQNLLLLMKWLLLAEGRKPSGSWQPHF